MSVHHHKLPIVTDGLVFQVDAANGLGGNITDTKNIAAPLEIGTFVNGLTVVNDAFDFDGVDDYIDFGNILNFGDSVTDQPFTFECWFNADTVADLSMVSKGTDGGGGGAEYLFTVDLSSSKLIGACYDGTGANVIFALGTVVIQPSTWYHAVFAYDGSGSSTGMEVYLNGVIDTSLKSGAGSYTAMHNTGDDFRLGRLWSTSIYQKGITASVKIYNRELTASEITQNYEATKHNFE